MTKHVLLNNDNTVQAFYSDDINSIIPPQAIKISNDLWSTYFDKSKIYYKTILINGEWVEGETEEEKVERESQQILESLKPSHPEIVDAELETKMLVMLTELGVIQ